MRKILNWVARYWYVPIAVLAAIAAAIWTAGRKRQSPAKAISRQVKAEMRVVSAETEVKRIQAELGAEQAKQHVKDRYQAELFALDAKQAAEATALEADPAALAKFLVRAGSK